jgi:hypothetical protein
MTSMSCPVLADRNQDSHRLALRAFGERLVGGREHSDANPSVVPPRCPQPRGRTAKARAPTAQHAPYTKPSNGLEPLTPSLPWKCSTN